MRLFEILTLLALLPPLFQPLLQSWLPADRRRWLDGFPFLSAIFIVLHLFLEGYRWQMVPAYLLAGLLVLLSLLSAAGPRANRPKSLAGRLAAVSGGLLWLALAAALPALLPVPDVPAPGGPYEVGTLTAHLVDVARPEIYSEDPTDRRQLMVQIWYPARPGQEGRPAPYIQDVGVAGPAIARRLDLPPFLLNHVRLVETDATVGAAVAADGPYPLLIFSHGLRGLRGQNTVLMQELASQGYVVAGIDHTYGNVLTVFPDGRIVFYDNEAVFPQGLSSVEAGARLVDVWAADVLFVSEQIAAWNAGADHLLSGQVDLTRIGTLGHSTGGGAAIEACVALTGCGAALGLDPWIEPVSDSILVQGFDRPLMLMTAPEWLGAENRHRGLLLYRNLSQDAYLLTVAGTEHFDFSDIPLLSPLTTLMGLSGPIDGHRVLTIINRYSVAFFDEALNGQPPSLLEGPSPAFPEVTFGP